MSRTDTVDRQRIEELERSLRNHGRAGDATPALASDAPPGVAPQGVFRTLDEAEDPDGSETVFAIMGGSARKGRWEPPAHIKVYALMGGVELDFRDADMLEGVTEVRAYTMWGGINIIVPPDIDVEANGMGLMGGFSHMTQRAEQDGAPLLRIRGVALMAGVDVKVRTLKKKKKRME